MNCSGNYVHNDICSPLISRQLFSCLSNEIKCKVSSHLNVWSINFSALHVWCLVISMVSKVAYCTNKLFSYDKCHLLMFTMEVLDSVW